MFVRKAVQNVYTHPILCACYLSVKYLISQNQLQKSKKNQANIEFQPNLYEPGRIIP